MIFEEEMAAAFSEIASQAGIRGKIHLAVDTGMSRIGMTPDEASADEAARISRLPGICIEGMFTHFARADEADKAFYEAQYKKYREFCEMLCSRGWISRSATAPTVPVSLSH